MKNALSVLRLTLFIPSTLYNAFVIQKLWYWFFVPLGLMEIKMAHALGIYSLVVYFTHQFDTEKLMENKTEEQKIQNAVGSLIVMIFKPSFALAFGWLYTQFM